MNPQEWQTLMDAGSGDWKESVQLVRPMLCCAVLCPQSCVS